jgi:hypothetical protein
MPKVTGNLIMEILNQVLPDGATRTWPELLATAREFGVEDQVKALAFGAPEKVARKGNNFTASAAGPATMNRWGIVVHSRNVVTFTFERVGKKEEFKVTNITGVRVKPPVAGEFDLTFVNIRIDAQGNLVVGTRYYFLPVSLKITPEGRISFF